MKFTIILTAAAAVLGACGGGSENQSPAIPEQLDQARYSASFNQLSEQGELVNGTGSAYVYAARSTMGFGSWSFTSAGGSSSMELLSRRVDDLGNETPGARPMNQTRALSIQKSGSTWSGGGLVLTRSDAAAPNLIGIPRNYRFRNLYRFGVELVDYSVTIDVDSAGTLSGFDTNGCSFRGTISPRAAADALYDVTITTTLCGDTARFVENATFAGYGYTMPGPGAGQASLHLIGADRGQRVGIEVVVTSP